MSARSSDQGDSASSQPNRSVGTRLDATIVPGFALIVAVPLWYVGLTLSVSGLLADVTAQEFFITVLANFQWPGTSILLMIGAAVVLGTVLELLLWPRGWLWRATARRVGWPVLLLALGWAATGLADTLAVATGFRLWAIGPYLDLQRSGVALPDLLFTPLSFVAGLLIALLPEGLLGWSLARLWRVWRRGS